MSGGGQLSNAILYQQLERRFGREQYNVAGSPEGVVRAKARPRRHKTAPIRDHSGFGTFLSLVDPNDPEALSQAMIRGLRDSELRDRAAARARGHQRDASRCAHERAGG